MKPHTDLLDFTAIDTEEKSYILGLLSADGSVQNKPGSFILGLDLHVRDRELVEKVASLVSPTSKVNFRRNSAIFAVRSQSLVQQLGVHGIHPAKSLNMRIPSTVPPALLPHWIRGYFDGDGCASYTKQGFLIAFTGQLNILDFIKKWFEQQYPEYSVKPCKSKGTTSTYILQYKCRAAVAIAKLMYSNASIWMQRKKDICQPYLDKPLAQFIPRINYYGEVEPWTQPELDLLMKNLYLPAYKLLPLFPTRSRLGIKKKRLTAISKLSETARKDLENLVHDKAIKFRVPWAQEDLILLTSLISSGSTKNDLLLAFPTRGWQGIKQAALRCGISCYVVSQTTGKYWSAEEEQQLREMWANILYSVKDMSKQLRNRNKSAISAKARQLGLPDRRKMHRGTKPEEPSGKTDVQCN